MSDTSAAARRMLRSRTGATSPAARIRMACSMFSGARQLRQAARGARDWSPAQIFIDTYARDLDPAIVAAVVEHLEQREQDPDHESARP